MDSRGNGVSLFLEGMEISSQTLDSQHTRHRREQKPARRENTSEERAERTESQLCTVSINDCTRIPNTYSVECHDKNHPDSSENFVSLPEFGHILHKLRHRESVEEKARTVGLDVADRKTRSARNLLKRARLI